MADPQKIEQQAVLERERPEFEPVGMRTGSLMLYPSVKMIENFDSNIYAAPNNQKSDFITRVAPAVKIKTLNLNQGILANLSSEHGFHRNVTRENYNDYRADLSPYWTISRILKMKINLGWLQGHERRTDPEALFNRGSREPVTFQTTTGGFDARYKRSRTGLGLFMQRRYLDFKNGLSFDGSQSIVNDDRNRFENEAGVDVSYDILDKDNAVYSSLKWFNRDYKRGDFIDALSSYSMDKRDSDGSQVRIGYKMPITDLISFDANAGYHHQNFNDNVFSKVNTFIGEGSLLWKITPLTNISFGSHRNVFETNQNDAAVVVETQADTQVSHELRRNIVLQVSGALGQHNYRDSTREDDYWRAGFGGIYKMNRYLHWHASYVYDDRNSNFDAADYDKHSVFLSAKIQF